MDNALSSSCARMQPEIPAATLSWALLVGPILRINSANRLEWLVRFADPKQLGLDRSFGDDALRYFTERVDPEVIRRQAAETLKLAKSNKVFEETAFIGLAIDGTAAGDTTKAPCPFCHPIKDSSGEVTHQIHQLVMISVVGVGITLPFDVEPYKADKSEYGAGAILLKRAIRYLGLRFADYVVVDAKFATAPFLHISDEMGIIAIARLKGNLPGLSAAVEARFSNQPPTMTFQYGDDWIEAWDAEDFDPWEALEWPTVRVLRYKQHKKDGTVIQADWLTNIPIARMGTIPLFKRAKSRWEIENQMRFQLLRQGIQRRQEPLRHGAHSTSPPQQHAGELVVHSAGNDYRTAIPDSLSAPRLASASDGDATERYAVAESEARARQHELSQIRGGAGHRAGCSAL